jgi:hypothetical protein
VKDVDAKDTLRGGIAVGQDGLVYVAGQCGLDQFTQSLAPLSTPAPSPSPCDTWPHIAALLPAGPVTASGSTVSALATLPGTSAASTGSAAAPLQQVLVQFDTSSHTWQPVSFIDNIALDVFVGFVQGPGVFGQPAIIGDRSVGSGFVGFLAFPNAACGPPPFLFIFPGPNVPFGAGALDSSGIIWVASDPALNKAPSSAVNPSEIFAIDPNTSQVEHTVMLPPGSQVNGMVLGPDNAIWFTDGGLNKIGRVDRNGNFKEFPLPHGGSKPQGITVGNDGALWFTEKAGNRIGSITPISHIVTETVVPTSNAQPNGIIGCQNGNPCPAPSPRAVFFTEQKKLGKVTF